MVMGNATAKMVSARSQKIKQIALLVFRVALLRFENFHPRSSLTTQGLDVSHKEVNVSREGPF